MATNHKKPSDFYVDHDLTVMIDRKNYTINIGIWGYYVVGTINPVHYSINHVVFQGKKIPVSKKITQFAFENN